MFHNQPADCKRSIRRRYSGHINPQQGASLYFLCHGTAAGIDVAKARGTARQDFTRSQTWTVAHSC